MSVTAVMVKELRQRTGSGMMECKRALNEANGDMELAIDNMRKSGLAKADKKSGRIAAEGRIAVAQNDDTTNAVIIDINCETDFVAKGDVFKAFAEGIAAAILASDVTTIEAAYELLLADGKSIDEARREMIAKLGENITLRRFERVSATGGTGYYLHGEKIGVVVSLEKADNALAKDIAMHIAASKPVCVSESEVPAETIDREKAIFIAQAEESGKPAEIIEKMIGGRIRKFLAEITLEGQAFVKDDKVTVGKLVSSKDNKVTGFINLAVGEGIEKEEGDFAAEVMAQVRGA